MVRLELPVLHRDVEGNLAEPELIARIEPFRLLRLESGLQREDERIGSHRRAQWEAGRPAPPPPPRQHPTPQRPPSERKHRRLQIPAPLGQLIDLRGGRRGELASADDSGLLELAQPLSEDV